MGLNVKERGEIVATFRYVQVQLMETLAAWVPTTPEMEVKLLFGAHIWDVAQHADALGKRTYELRLPLQHSRQPSAAALRLLQELSAAEETEQRIAGFYDVALPLLSNHLNQYLAQTDTLMDGPTVRILERMLNDETRMKRECDDLRQELPNLPPVDQQWVAHLAELGAGLDKFFFNCAETAAEKQQ
jgi:hypothetical protein